MTRSRVQVLRRCAGLTVAAALLAAGTALGAVRPAQADPIPTGSISGFVNGDDGDGIRMVAVFIHATSGPAWDTFVYADADGRYLFPHVAPGTYEVYIDGDNLNYYSTVYFDPDYPGDRLTGLWPLARPTPIVVGTANVELQTVTLQPQPGFGVDSATDLTGVVTEAGTARPVGGIGVDAYDAATGQRLGSSRTDHAGRYVFNDLDGATAVKLNLHDTSYGGDDFAYQETWSGGATSLASAAPVPLTTSTVDYSVALTRTSGVRGRVLAPAGVPAYGATADVYDLDGVVVASAEVRGDGRFSVAGLTTDQSYKVRFRNGYDYAGNDDDNERHYYLDTWYGGDDFASARTVPGGATGVDGTFQDDLTAFEAPRVRGRHAIGRALTGTVGRWNRSAGSTFELAWLRGDSVVGTGSTYTLTTADAGQPIELRVTNTNVDARSGQVRSASATTAPAIAKFASKVSAHARPVAQAATPDVTDVVVTVDADPQAAAAVTGTVAVSLKGKEVAVLSVSKGKAIFPDTFRGRHSFTLTYSGNATTRAAHATVTITRR